MAEQPADADLAQLVERNLAKVEVAGSNLVIRSIRVKGPVIFGLLALMRLGQGKLFRSLSFELRAQRSRLWGVTL